MTTHPDGATCMLVEYAVRGSLDTLLSDLAEKNAPPSEAVNPQPHTPNPKPQTANPKPQTPNPQPKTRSHTALDASPVVALLAEGTYVWAYISLQRT